jgi:hypothetical protein
MRITGRKKNNVLHYDSISGMTLRFLNCLYRS